MGCWTRNTLDAVRARSVAEGFDVFGLAAAPAVREPAGEQTAQRFTQWVDQGRAGDMHYLKRADEHGELLRTSARVAMPWARSVIVCGFHYNLGRENSLAPAAPGSGWIGRYAWLGTATQAPADYHDELLRRMRVVEAELQACTPCQTRAYVDTGPLLERDFAARAGVGWVGKNTCVLNQHWGSWLLLAVLVTSLDVPADQVSLPAADRCGTCTRCLDACPTGALVAPREMDAARCIAYLTIEKKDAIPEPLREPMGRQVFGCDICQDVCPWNDRNGHAPISIKPGLALREDLVNPSLDWLGALDQPAFKRHFAGSPLERTRRHRLQRNVAIAMGNSGDPGFAPRLRKWAAGSDSVLAETAQWALGRLKLEPAALLASEQE